MIAEFWNTISNIAFVVLCSIGVGVFSSGFYGHTLRWELMSSLGGLLLVGVGSAAFHGTLLWRAQLLDELPMVYASCIFISCLFHTTFKRKWGRIIPVMLALYGAVVTAVYVHTQDFQFFIAAYGLQVSHRSCWSLGWW